MAHGRPPRDSTRGRPPRVARVRPRSAREVQSAGAFCRTCRWPSRTLRCRISPVPGVHRDALQYDRIPAAVSRSELSGDQHRRVVGRRPLALGPLADGQFEGELGVDGHDQSVSGSDANPGYDTGASGRDGDLERRFRCGLSDYCHRNVMVSETILSVAQFVPVRRQHTRKCWYRYSVPTDRE